MGNSLYNELNGVSHSYQQPQNNVMNIMAQLRQVQQNPGAILDIMLQKGRITQQQYQDMQSIRNNPQAVAQYLMNHGHANEIKDKINIAQQQIINLK